MQLLSYYRVTIILQPSQAVFLLKQKLHLNIIMYDKTLKSIIDQLPPLNGLYKQVFQIRKKNSLFLDSCFVTYTAVIPIDS